MFSRMRRVRRSATWLRWCSPRSALCNFVAPSLIAAAKMNLDEAADAFEAAAQELERAVLHYRSVTVNFRSHEVPRACAHVCVAQ